jgi:hypothetical protein
MEDRSTTIAAPASRNHASPLAQSGTQPFSMQQPGKDAFTVPGQPTATSTHRDSVLEEDVIRRASFTSERRASEASHGGLLPNGIRHITGDGKSMTGVAFAIHSPSPTPNTSNQRRESIVPSNAQDELSTGLHQLQIPQSHVLPMIQPQTPMNDAPSPMSQQSLPPISHMVGDIPRSASISEEGRTNGLVHRQSISSLTQSPTSRVRQMSISSHTHTPVSPFPLSASSPMSANSDVRGGDMFLRSGSHVFGVDNRRPSQASETGRLPPRLDSTSTSEGYQSSDGPSPGSVPTPVEQRPRHLSLDGTLASASGGIFLPPPNNSGIQAMGQHSLGAFRCEYLGCNALPFQTQYLLK